MKPAAHPSRFERPQPPGERQDRRRQAERHDVGQRIELDAEGRRRVGQPREEAVERVEHHRDADEQRRGVEVAARRVDDARVAAEQVRDREQRRQQEHAAPEALRPVAPAAPQRKLSSTGGCPASREHGLAGDDLLADRDAQLARRSAGTRPCASRTSSGRSARRARASPLRARGRRCGAPACRRPGGRRSAARRDRSRSRSARCRSSPRRRPAGTCPAGTRCA